MALESFTAAALEIRCLWFVTKEVGPIHTGKIYVGSGSHGDDIRGEGRYITRHLSEF